MNREFIINLLFLIGINIIIKPFYLFGIDLKVQNELDNYGLYFALLNLSYILQIFTDLGIHQYNNRTISQHNYLFEKYFPSLLLLKACLSFVFIFIALIIAFMLGYEYQQLYLFGFLIVNQILITLCFFFRSNIAGLQHFRVDSCLSVLDKLIMIVLCIPFLWGPLQDIFNLQLFVYLQSCSFAFTAIAAFFLTRKYLQRRLRFRFNLVLFIVLLKKSLPYSLVVLLMTIYTRVDAVMIERLLYDPVSNKGIQQANIYAAAYRLLDAVNMVCFMFAGLLLPMFASLLKKKGDYLSLLKLSTSMMLVLTVSFSVAFCVNAPEIMPFLYKKYSLAMTDVAIVLMLGFNSIGMIHIIGTFLTANGNLLLMNLVLFLGIVINVVFNYFLINLYGAYGAAIATLLTQTFVALAEYLIIKSLFGLRWKLSYLASIFVFILGVCSINYGLHCWGNPWWFNLITAGLGSILWASLSQLLNLKRILSIFRTKSA